MLRTQFNLKRSVYGSKRIRVPTQGLLWFQLPADAHESSTRAFSPAFSLVQGRKDVCSSKLPMPAASYQNRSLTPAITVNLHWSIARSLIQYHYVVLTTTTFKNLANAETVHLIKFENILTYLTHLLLHKI